MRKSFLIYEEMHKYVYHIQYETVVSLFYQCGCAPEGLKNRQPHKSRKQSLNTGLDPQSTYIYRVQSSVWRLQNY
jgi:hypothetical protein